MSYDIVPANKRPLQFSISTALAVVTGVSILLSLSMWNQVVGGPSSVVLVCGFWAVMAVRAGFRRLAYYLVAVVLGPITLGVLALPFWVVSDFPSSGSADGWGAMWLLFVCVLSTLITTRLLRWNIRQPGVGACFSSAVCCVFITASAFCVCFGMVGSITAMIEEESMIAGLFVIGISMVGMMLSPVVAMIFMPLAGPVAFGSVWLLRYVDPVEPQPARHDSTNRLRHPTAEEGESISFEDSHG